MSGLRRCRTTTVACADVQQALSATRDGEAPGMRAKKRHAHLRACPECRAFEAGVSALSGLMVLDGTRRAPDGLTEMLALELARTVGPPQSRATRRQRSCAPRAGWRRPVQWAGALIPAIALVVLLPLGAFSAASGSPTHASTPCTVNLHTSSGHNP